MSSSYTISCERRPSTISQNTQEVPLIIATKRRCLLRHSGTADPGNESLRPGVIAERWPTEATLRRELSSATILPCVRSRLVVVVVLAAFLSVSLDGFAGTNVHLARFSESAATRAALGKIQWLLRHEPRGESLASAGLSVGSTSGSHWQPVRFVRVVSPAPRSGWKLAVSLIGKRGRNICLTIYKGRRNIAGGCAFGSLLRPFSAMTTTNGDQIAFSGLASDRVARLALVLANGKRLPVPLLDNAFLIVLPMRDHPLRLIAYDRSGTPIGGSRASIPRLG